MNISTIIIYIMVVFMALGALDKIIGNKFGLGEKFDEGIMEMEESSFPWTLQYDEVDYIIEGALEIKIGDAVIRGEAGDILFIPKGSSISFVAPGKTRFLYVTYPADWAEQE